MGRWRPPDRPGSKYVTPEGHRRLREELDQLWRVERPQVTQAVSEAAAQGDRSENAEYTYGKKRLREIDRRVRFLRKRLDGMVVVDRAPPDRERVYFGAWVELEDERGETVEHRIVGPDEFDLDPRYVSMDAPLGRALLGKRLDDEFAIDLPAGRRTYVIVGIRYEAPG
jgi:transcription elongation factor GreB